MIGYKETIGYALLQGFTEFLPVSSSGHLAVINLFITQHQDLLFFFVVLHLGTLLSVVTYFLQEIVDLFKGAYAFVIIGEKSASSRNAFNLIVNIIIVTLVTGGLVFPFKHFVEESFDSITLIAINFCITGFILFVTIIFRNNREERVSFRTSVFVGLAQAFAALPGISRSGATISAGMISGLRGEEAFRFSFLVSIPAVFGATLLEFPGLAHFSRDSVTHYIVGFVVSFLSGIFALKVLSSIINKNKFYYFSFYCIPLGLLLLALTQIGAR